MDLLLINFTLLMTFLRKSKRTQKEPKKRRLSECFRISSEKIEVDAYIEGIDEFKKVVKVTVFNGMSGSFAYTISEGIIPYKCFGILSNGDRDSGQAWVIPIINVLALIEQEFF